MVNKQTKPYIYINVFNQPTHLEIITSFSIFIFFFHKLGVVCLCNISSDIIQFIKTTLDFSSAFKKKLQSLKTHRLFWKTKHT